jgi:hypothetical protein
MLKVKGADADEGEEDGDFGEVLRKLRHRGRSSNPGRLAYFEWSCHETANLDDHHEWAIANPALGYRLTVETIEDERNTMSDAGFARERLSISPEPEAASVFGPQWLECIDKESLIADDSDVYASIDVRRDRTSGAISVAGKRMDGMIQGEVIVAMPGANWVLDAAEALWRRWDVKSFIIDGGSQAAALLPELQERGIPVTVTTAKDMVHACGLLYDAVTDTRTFRHRDQPELNRAVIGASTRELEAAWAWDRRFGTDITPLVSVTLAVWGLMHGPARGDPLNSFW